MSRNKRGSKGIVATLVGKRNGTPAAKPTQAKPAALPSGSRLSTRLRQVQERESGRAATKPAQAMDVARRLVEARETARPKPARPKPAPARAKPAEPARGPKPAQIPRSSVPTLPRTGLGAIVGGPRPVPTQVAARASSTDKAGGGLLGTGWNPFPNNGGAGATGGEGEEEGGRGGLFGTGWNPIPAGSETDVLGDIWDTVRGGGRGGGGGSSDDELEDDTAEGPRGLQPGQTMCQWLRQAQKNGATEAQLVKKAARWVDLFTVQDLDCLAHHGLPDSVIAAAGGDVSALAEVDDDSWGPWTWGGVVVGGTVVTGAIGYGLMKLVEAWR